MFTSSTDTREQVLKAVAATQRAMKRHECSKSQFKFKCFSCGKMINRGDKITRCVRDTTGMSLRYRGAGGECGLTVAETAFYQAETGKDLWVHIGCQPYYWDKGFDNGDEYSPPVLRAMPTEWGTKVMMEFEDWTSGPGGCAWKGDHESYFLSVKGYPKEKSMRARILQAVTRFQALWRGYIYKKAYPIARQRFAAVEADLNKRVRNGFLQNNSLGGHVEILFDERRKTAAIYSAEIIKIQGLPEIDGLYYWVKFHHDDEVRRYHWKKLLHLKVECDGFKTKQHGVVQVAGVELCHQVTREDKTVAYC